MGIDVTFDFRSWSERNPEEAARQLRLEQAFERASKMDMIRYEARVHDESFAQETLMAIAGQLGSLSTAEEVTAINDVSVGLRPSAYRNSRLLHTGLEIAHINPNASLLTVRNKPGTSDEDLLGSSPIRTFHTSELLHISFNQFGRTNSGQLDA